MAGHTRVLRHQILPGSTVHLKGTGVYYQNHTSTIKGTSHYQGGFQHTAVRQNTWPHALFLDRKVLNRCELNFCCCLGLQNILTIRYYICSIIEFTVPLFPARFGRKLHFELKSCLRSWHREGLQIGEVYLQQHTNLRSSQSPPCQHGLSWDKCTVLI